MKNLLSDIWLDLRQKRLWPVAAVLLVGIVAVPVVLSKPAENDALPPVATAAPKPAESKQLARLTTVTLEESAPGEGSSLDTFDPSDPFRPPASVVKQGKSAQPDSTPAGPSEESVAVDDSNSVTVDEGTSNGCDGGSTGGQQGSEKTTTTTQYKYVIDITFTANGHTRKVKGMERLDMLPSQANPLLLFLGAETSGDNAVFLVDSTLTAAGEGRCEPSADKCGYLHLGAGSEHEFTNEAGDSYTLRIDEIRKVEVGDAKPKASRKPRAGASVGSTRPFVPALISDLVTVSTTDAEGSNPDSDGR